MHKIYAPLVISAALVALMAGCQKNDAPVVTVTANGEPAQNVVDRTPIAQMPTRDPSLPDATTVFAALDAADKAKAMQETASLQQQEPGRQKELTKTEESKAMPLPGQANDHSSPKLNKGATK